MLLVSISLGVIMALGLGISKKVEETQVTAPEVTVPMNSSAPTFPVPNVIPRRASVRETIDSPETLKDIDALYNKNKATFSPIQGNMGHYNPETLYPINTEGRFGEQSTGGDREGDGSMHVNAIVPKNSLAVIHTHPYGEQAQTSSDDETVANTLQRPNYALSGNALWVAEPGNKEPRKVANLSYKKGHLQYGWLPVPIPEPGK